MDCSKSYVFCTNVLCGSYAQSQRHLNMNTHSSFVSYFPSAAASNDAFPVVSFSEPEGALATILPAYKYIHTVYALNTCTHKCKHRAILKKYDHPIKNTDGIFTGMEQLLVLLQQVAFCNIFHPVTWSTTFTFAFCRKK